jgi:hypothetical protein
MIAKMAGWSPNDSDITGCLFIISAGACAALEGTVRQVESFLHGVKLVEQKRPGLPGTGRDRRGEGAVRAEDSLFLQFLTPHRQKLGQSTLRRPCEAFTGRRAAVLPYCRAAVLVGLIIWAGLDRVEFQVFVCWRRCSRCLVLRASWLAASCSSYPDPCVDMPKLGRAGIREDGEAW